MTQQTMQHFQLCRLCCELTESQQNVEHWYEEGTPSYPASICQGSYLVQQCMLLSGVKQEIGTGKAGTIEGTDQKG